MISLHYIFSQLLIQEKKINKNDFAEESEAVWKTMKEVEMCENLSSVIQR